MAINATGKRGRKGPPFTKRIQADVVRGVPRVRAWPPKKPVARSQKWKDQIEWFTQANWATKYWPAEFQWTIREAVKGSPFYPRDIMLMLMSGRFAYVSFTDGSTYYPMAARQDISQSLDVLSSVPNSVLVRGPDWWVAATAPLPNMILQSGPVGGPPSWQVVPFSTPYCRLFNPTQYTVPAGQAPKVVGWVVEADTLSGWDAANQRYVVPTGVNLLEAAMTWEVASGSNSAMAGYVRLNGNTVGQNGIQIATFYETTVQCPPIEVVPGDVIEFFNFSSVSRTFNDAHRMRAWIKILG